MVKNKGVEDISNKTLASLLIVAIVISLGGTLFLMQSPGMIHITGAVTETGSGTLSAEVEQVTAINLTTATIDFGTGRVTAGQASCTLNSQASTTGCDNFSTVTTGFQIENLGNMNVSLQVQSTEGSNAFIGGTSAAYQWQVNQDAESGACRNDTGYSSGETLNASVISGWNNIGATAQYVCPWFITTDATDMLELDLNIDLPSDTSPGALSDTFTFTATTI